MCTDVFIYSLLQGSYCCESRPTWNARAESPKGNHYGIRTEILLSFV